MTSGRKVLLLTGASRGIGHAMVKRFSDTDAWRVITCSRDTVPEECKRDPNWSHHITADLADPKDLDRFIAEAGSAHRPRSRFSASTGAIAVRTFTFSSRIDSLSVLTGGFIVKLVRIWNR